MNRGGSTQKLNRDLVALETFVAGGLLLIVFIVVLSQVVMRYLFAQPNPWSEELSRFCFIWLSMLGASLAVERQSHFGFDQALKRLLRPSSPLGAAFCHSRRS